MHPRTDLCAAPTHVLFYDRKAMPAHDRRPLEGLSGSEIWAAVICVAVSMVEMAEPCWALIDRTRGRIGDHVAELRLVPDRGVCTAYPRLDHDVLDLHQHRQLGRRV